MRFLPDNMDKIHSLSAFSFELSNFDAQRRLPLAALSSITPYGTLADIYP
jgi:hypothetical protein